ncbi:hypothetical protein CTA2_10858, partial [Colletotrichum tanaceti]
MPKVMPNFGFGFGSGLLRILGNPSLTHSLTHTLIHTHTHRLPRRAEPHYDSRMEIVAPTPEVWTSSSSRLENECNNAQTDANKLSERRISFLSLLSLIVGSDQLYNRLKSTLNHSQPPPPRDHVRHQYDRCSVSALGTPSGTSERGEHNGRRGRGCRAGRPAPGRRPSRLATGRRLVLLVLQLMGHDRLLRRLPDLLPGHHAAHLGRRHRLDRLHPVVPPPARRRARRAPLRRRPPPRPDPHRHRPRLPRPVHDQPRLALLADPARPGLLRRPRRRLPLHPLRRRHPPVVRPPPRPRHRRRRHRQRPRRRRLPAHHPGPPAAPRLPLGHARRRLRLPRHQRLCLCRAAGAGAEEEE